MKKLGARLRRTLAVRVEEVCRKQGIAAKTLAHKARFDVRTIRNFFNGKPVKEDTIRKICVAVGVDFNLELEGHAPVTKSSDADHGMYSEDFDHFQPSVSPTYFRKITHEVPLDRLIESVGPIEPADPNYAEANRILTQTEEGVVNFA